MKTVLVTGGAGFIGCTLAPHLLRSGHRVVALDSLHPQVHATAGRPALLPADVELWPVDVTSPTAWHAVLNLVEPDVVVHLAAETGTGQSLSQASRHASVNVLGTTVMLDALFARERRPDHVIVASSRAVYGEGDWIDGEGHVFHPGARRHEDLLAARWDAVGPDGKPGRPLPSRARTTAPRPTNIYAATKLAQEHLLTAWGAATGTAVSILRLQNVYGPGQSLTNSYTGVLALFGRLAIAGQPIEVYEDGAIVRDFVFVEDVARALAAAVDSPPEVVRRLDIGSGVPSTLLDVARTVAAAAGAPEPFISGKFRDGDVRAASCDIADAATDLGFVPAWDLARGIAALTAWVGDTLGVAR